MEQRHIEVIQITEETGEVQVTKDTDHHPHKGCGTVAQALGKPVVLVQAQGYRKGRVPPVRLMEGDVLKPRSEIRGAEKGVSTKGSKVAGLVGQRVGILEGLGIKPVRPVQILKSPGFFKTRTSGEAYLLTDLLMIPFNLISVYDSELEGHADRVAGRGDHQ